MTAVALLAWAVGSTDAPSQHAMEDPGDRVASLERQMRELVPEDADLRYPPEFVVEFGVPADKMLRTAAERSVSLIVLGVRHQAGPRTDHQWEVTHRVACEAYCPVLTFRARYFE